MSRSTVTPGGVAAAACIAIAHSRTRAASHSGRRDGTVMFITGMFEMFQGLAAILEDEFFVIGRAYAYSVDVTTWGWVHLGLGTIVAVAGLAVFTGATWARVVGIIFTVIAAIANFFTIPYYPVWSILVIATSIVVIWALASMSSPWTRPLAARYSRSSPRGARRSCG